MKNCKRKIEKMKKYRELSWRVESRWGEDEDLGFLKFSYDFTGTTIKPERDFDQVKGRFDYPNIEWTGFFLSHSS